VTDELKNVYGAAGALDRFFDDKTPIDLFRGLKTGGHADLMQPTFIGWHTRGEPRHPDVLVSDSVGVSPQYIGGDSSALVTEGKDKAETENILGNADKYVVKGCRTLAGKHRGISVFDKKNQVLRNFDWYKIEKGTDIPVSLAITRDSPLLESIKPIHYTIAPKDDMPLPLFLQHLKALGSTSKLDK
jgi:Tse2-like ADP-ribosyltransferase toxin